MKITRISLITPGCAGMLVGVIEFLRLLLFLRLPEVQIAQRLPDDAYYYLILAKNFASTGRWTFDGESAATGFHLFWGYLLAAVYAVAPGISFRAIIGLAAAIQIIGLSTAVALCWMTARKLFPPWSVLGISFAFTGAAIWIQPFFLLESCPLMCVAAAYLCTVIHTEPSVSPKRSGMVALLGLCGMLVRSDFGLLPFWLLVGYVAASGLNREWVSKLRTAAYGFAGSVCGLLVVLVHSYLVSGHITQASAREKLFWSAIEGPSIRQPLWILLHIFDPITNLNVDPYVVIPRVEVLAEKFGMLLLASFFFLCLVRWLVRHGNAENRILSAALLGVLLSYCVFYRFDGEVQSWYISSFIVPAAVLLAGAFSIFAKNLQRRFALVFVTAWGCIGFGFSLLPPFPWQAGHYWAGVYLRQHPALKNVGAWNSGILSYFGERPVVNLDGLVNDDVYYYSVHGQLAQYVEKRGLEYILDTQNMFMGVYPQRGGYSNGVLYGCIDWRKELPTHMPQEQQEPPPLHHMLYHINLGCLKSADREVAKR